METPIVPANLLCQPIDLDLLGSFLREMELNSLHRRVLADHPAYEPQEEIVSPPATDTVASYGASHAQGSLFDSPEMPDAASAEPSASVVKPDYATVTETAELLSMVNDARDVGFIAVDCETDSLDPMQANLLGISLSCAEGRGVYVPVAVHGGESAEHSILELALVRDILNPLWADPSVRKIGHNLKYDLLVMERAGFTFDGNFDDTMLMAFAAMNGRRYALDVLVRDFFEIDMVKFGDVVYGDRKTFADVPIEEATRYAAEDADMTLRLWNYLSRVMVLRRASEVYHTLERPLLPVLVRMQQTGIQLLPSRLIDLSAEFAASMEVLQQEVWQLAGKEFNLSSPMQVADVLFGEMGIPGGRKTPTGKWSTDAKVLDNLANSGHRCAQAIHEWRLLAKLRGT